jgi:hypothetical protein
VNGYFLYRFSLNASNFLINFFSNFHTIKNITLMTPSLLLDRSFLETFIFSSSHDRNQFSIINTITTQNGNRHLRFPYSDFELMHDQLCPCKLFLCIYCMYMYILLLTLNILPIFKFC